jgi:hypothetical protein
MDIWRCSGMGTLVTGVNSRFSGALLDVSVGVDVDGDTVDDFSILIAGNIAFGAGDFVL